MRFMLLRGTLLLLILCSGCFSSSSEPSTTTAGTTSGTTDGTTGGETKPSTTEHVPPQTPVDDVDDIGVPIMTEVDGIPIPRREPKSMTNSVKGMVPADVANPRAKTPSTPKQGGKLVVRFSAEPESLNPITETSAYQTYIHEYVQDALARMDGETLEYEPKLASKWITEDSIKFSADYAGRERRMTIDGGAPVGHAVLEVPPYEKKVDDNGLTVSNGPTYAIQTFDGAGNALGKVWVGLFAIEPKEMVGAPVNGVHLWSDENGKLDVSGLVSGRYNVYVGAEAYGVSTRGEDGKLTVTAGSPDNPLSDELKAAGKKSLELTSGDYVNVQQGNVFTFYLREDATWSDGKPFTSADLEFAYHVINSSFVDGDSLRVYYSDLIECRPLGPHVIRMTYREQYFRAFEFAYGLAFYAPPKHFFEEMFRADDKTLTDEILTDEEEKAQKKVSVHGKQFGQFFNNDARYNDRPLGVGPYVVEKREKGKSVTLRRRADYWDKEGAGYLDEIQFKFEVDGTTALRQFSAGEYGFLWNLSPEQFYEELESPAYQGIVEKDYVKATWFSPGFSYVGWNMLNPKFQDRRVRLALAMLFDVDNWIKIKLHGGAIAVSGSQYIFGPAYDHKVYPIGYDPETARDLLADAGWFDSDGDGVIDKNGEPFRFSMTISNGSKAIEDQIAQVQVNLKGVGIEMSIEKYEWATFIDKIKNKTFDACRLSWAQSLESDPYQIWHGSQAGKENRGSNHVSFDNPEADRLIEAIRVTVDEKERLKLHYAFHRLLDSEQPYLFLYTSKDFGVYHQKYRGVKWYPLRPGFDFRDWYIAE